MKINKKTQTTLWVAGLAGSVTTAQGALVQVNLAGNSVTAGGGVSLSDLGTTFGVDFAPQVDGYNSGFNSFENLKYRGRIRINGQGTARAQSTNQFGFTDYFAQAPNQFNQNGQFGPNGSTQGAFTVAFSVNGVSTSGYLFVTSGGSLQTRGVQIDSVVWDDADPSGSSLGTPASVFASGPTVLGSSPDGAGLITLAEANAVPEPSGLTLLALGSAGLVARRRRKAA